MNLFFRDEIWEDTYLKLTDLFYFLFLSSLLSSVLFIAILLFFLFPLPEALAPVLRLFLPSRIWYDCSFSHEPALLVLAVISRVEEPLLTVSRLPLSRLPELALTIFKQVAPEPLSSHVDSGTSIPICSGKFKALTRVLFSEILCSEWIGSPVFFSVGLSFTGELFNQVLSSMVLFSEVLCSRERFPEELSSLVLSFDGIFFGEFVSVLTLTSRVCSRDWSRASKRVGEGAPIFAGDFTLRRWGEGVRPDLLLGCLGDNLGDKLRHWRTVSFLLDNFGLDLLLFVEDSSVFVVIKGRNDDADVISDVTGSKLDDVMDDVACVDAIVVMVTDVTGGNDKVAVVTFGDVKSGDVIRGDVIDNDNTCGRGEEYERMAKEALLEFWFFLCTDPYTSWTEIVMETYGNIFESFRNRSYRQGLLQCAVIINLCNDKCDLCPD